METVWLMQYGGQLLERGVPSSTVDPLDACHLVFTCGGGGHKVVLLPALILKACKRAADVLGGCAIVVCIHLQ